MSDSSSDVGSEIDYLQENCEQAFCSTSLSFQAGQTRKTRQLIWFPLLPAIALLVYSSFYLYCDVTDYSKKVGHLHDSKDIEAAGSCLEPVRRIQTLRYTSTLYLGSKFPVHSVEPFVDHAFEDTAKALSEVAVSHWEPDQPCSFADIIREYFSKMNFGQTDIYVDRETLKNFCTLWDFILESLSQLRNLTVGLHKSELVRAQSTFGLIVDLMHVDCIKYVTYVGSSAQIVKSLERYHALVNLEKVYSRMSSIGAVYYSRGHLEQPERRAMLADLRLAAHYVSFDQLDVEVPDTVRTVIAEVLDINDDDDDDDHKHEMATSFGLVRWTEVMQAFIADLNSLVDEQLADIGSRISAERSTLHWHVAIGAFAWVAVICLLLPITTVNAMRTIDSIRLYGRSCVDKEFKLRREKHEVDALIREMLPRSENLPCSRRSLCVLTMIRY